MPALLGLRDVRDDAIYTAADVAPLLAPALPKPVLRGLADGLAADRSRYLRLLGNGCVPLCAAMAFRTLWAVLDMR